MWLIALFKFLELFSCALAVHEIGKRTSARPSASLLLASLRPDVNRAPTLQANRTIAFDCCLCMSAGNSYAFDQQNFVRTEFDSYDIIIAY